MTKFVPLSQYTDTNLRSGKCVEKFAKNFTAICQLLYVGVTILHWATPKNFADYFAVLVLHIFRLFLS